MQKPPDRRTNRRSQCLNEMIRNTSVQMQIQKSFMKVRGELEMMNLHYAWFKIRTNNNGDVM